MKAVGASRGIRRRAVTTLISPYGDQFETQTAMLAAA
jgi:hypothetical protein